MKLQYNLLYDSTTEILAACGESEKNASMVAKNLIKADARGITTHGTYLLTPIWERAQARQLSLPSEARITSDNGAVAIVDGGNGLGAVAGMLAINTAVEKARQFGIASVLINNTNNVGALACYTEIAAREGMIALMGCNAAPAMAPW